MASKKALLAALAVLPLAAACGSSDDSTVSSGGSTPSVSSSSDGGSAGYDYGGRGDYAATTLKLRTSALGTYLTDSAGRALYLFEKDGTNTSVCSGACAAAWPPVQATDVGPGLQMGMLAQVSRSDGTKQSSYGGHPLYYYAGDSSPGQTRGQGLDQFGAEWYVIDAHGKKIDSD